VVSGSIQNVRLMDSRNGMALLEASSTRQIGKSKWRVSFGPASGQELAVGAAGNLVISGLLEGKGRAFLAPVPEVKGSARRELRSEPTIAGISSVGELALEGFLPNPAVATTAISFSLPDYESATLQVLDVRGRIVFKEDVGGLGPGTHLVRLDGSTKLLPGIFWIRLVRADRTLLEKGIVVR
jgi:hypothetical protein